MAELPESIEIAAAVELPAVPERYAAQLRLPEFGLAGQAKLAAARVLCIGCGGLAASVLPYLVAAGVGHITILDHDVVTESNLNRQLLFTPADVGLAKVTVAVAQLARQNPAVELVARCVRFDLASGAELLVGYDLIVDCSDDYATKLALNYCCQQLAIPWVYASVLAWDGQVALFTMDSPTAPCYKCWQIKSPLMTSNSCSVSGVLGAAVNVVGSYQASLALQALVGDFSRANHLYALDLWTLEQQQFRLVRRPDCQYHGMAATTLAQDYIDYAKIVADPSAYCLIDIRSVAEWEVGHLAGAIHLPLGQLLREAPQRFNPAQKLVVYCNQHSLSLRAMENLRHLGLSVQVLSGGLIANQENKIN